GGGGGVGVVGGGGGGGVVGGGGGGVDGGVVAEGGGGEEGVRVCVLKGARAVRHRDRIAGPDVRDAGCDDQRRRGGEEEARVREDLLASERLRDPQRPEAERLHFLREPALVRRGHAFELEAPHADRSEPRGCLACGV